MNIISSIIGAIVTAIGMSVVYIDYLLVTMLWSASKAVVTWINAPQEVSWVLLLVLITAFTSIIIGLLLVALFLVGTGIKLWLDL